MGSAAIVTMIVGDRYRELWQRVCKANWEHYAHKYGFDLIVIEEPLDRAEGALRRGLSWQKLLVGRVEGVQRYDRVVWIDADIVINAGAAPNILEDVPAEKVGAVHYHALLRYPLLTAAHRRVCFGKSVEELNTELFQVHGLSADPHCMISAGVLALSHHHLPFLEAVYRKYPREADERHQEQVVLSYELFKAGLTHFIDDRFNAIWYEYKYGLYFGDENTAMNRKLLRSLLPEVYFLHFAGNQEEMLLLVD